MSNCDPPRPMRRFRVPEGRIVTLPVDLCPGPGVTNMRVVAGGEIDLEVARCTTHTRFLNGRLRAGDLVELGENDPPNLDAIAPQPLTKPGDGPVRVVTGAPLTTKG